MREVIINPNSYGFHQKKQFFEGQSWLKFNNFRLVLGMTLKIDTFVRKVLKLSVEGNQQGTFLHFPLSS